MSKQHTPYRLNSDFIEIIDSEDNIIVDCLTIDQAEFIVKACNNHDRLVEALKKMVNEFDAEHATHYQCELCYEVNELLTELKEKTK